MKQDRGIEPFVDRHRELAEVRAGVDRALGGEGRFFTICGEPGVGKSRLAREAAAYAEGAGARVLWGRCWEHGGAPAYWPWTQVIRSLTSQEQAEPVVSWLGAGAADIAQIAPHLRDQIADLPELPSAELAQPEKARFRLFDSVASFLRKAAETRPLFIVLDDLHAADPTSVMMLVAVARQIRSMRATLVATYREVEVRHAPELAALISQAEREGAVLPLRGLGQEDIRDFLELGWGVAAGGVLVDQLRDITEGNPFFLHEVLRQMAAEGQLEREASMNPRRLKVSRGVHDYIKALAQPLSENARCVLDTASVVGREFTVDVVQAACPVEGQDVIELLDEARALDLIDEASGASGHYAFRHALIREALYEAMPASARRRQHRVIAEALRKINDPSRPVAEIAYHYCQAMSSETADLAIDYSRLAAQAAEKQLAFEDAANHLRNAIDALRSKRESDDALHAELLCEVGSVEAKAGDFAAARKTSMQAAGIARRLDRAETFARAVVTAGRGISNSGVTDGELVQLLKEALDRLGGKDRRLQAQALARLGVELYWSERDTAVRLCRQAVDMARSLGDPHTQIVALWGSHITQRNPDSLERRLAEGREAVALAEQAGERDFALEARFFHIADLVEAGDFEGFDAGVREYLEAEAKLRDRFQRGLLLRGMRALMEGRLHEAETLAEQAFAAGQLSGRPLALNSFLIQQGMTLWELGRFGEFEMPLKDFVAKNPLIVFARCALQLSFLQLGRPEDARAEFDIVAEDGFRRVARDWNWLPSMFVLAEVCAELGDAARAETLYALLAPFASRNAVLGYVYTFGSVSLALGKLAAVLGRYDAAERHLESALAANRKIRTIVWTAHAQCELANALLLRGNAADVERAQQLIAAAREAGDRLGLVRLKQRLSRIGAESSTAPEGVPAIDGAPVGAGAVAQAGGLGALEALANSVISRARDLAAVGSMKGAVAILFSDLEDSSVLYEKFGDQRAHEIIRVHNAIFRQKVAAFRGHEVKALGDGFMIAFSSARRAVLCAIAVQKAFASYSAGRPDMPLRVRIGLHVGEAIKESSDLFGRAVILSARMAALAKGGQIVVSSELHDALAKAGDLTFAPLGDMAVKGFAGTHSVYEVVW